MAGADSPANQRTEVLLSWRDLSVKLPGGGPRPKYLLRHVSGFAQPGSLLAIMGPSGCGKTTLLNTLAGRLGKASLQSGEILANGRKQQLTYGNSAYVTQDDSLIATLTVYETIVYAAHLQLPNGMSKYERHAVVLRTIREMGLQDCVNTKIGGWYVRGISGGQKRRVSIAIEILKQPQLLFLDEPTSGLDRSSWEHPMLVLDHELDQAFGQESWRVICSSLPPLMFGMESYSKVGVDDMLGFGIFTLWPLLMATFCV